MALVHEYEQGSNSPIPTSFVRREWRGTLACRG